MANVLHNCVEKLKAQHPSGKKVLTTMALAVFLGASLGIPKYLLNEKDKQIISLEETHDMKIISLKENYDSKLFVEQEEKQKIKEESEKWKKAYNEGVLVLEEKFDHINSQRPGLLEPEIIEIFKNNKGSASLSGATLDELVFIASYAPGQLDIAEREKLIRERGIERYIPRYGFKVPLMDTKNAIVTSERGDREWFSLVDGDWESLGNFFTPSYDLVNYVDSRIIAPYDGKIIWVENYHQTRPKGDPMRNYGRVIYYQIDEDELLEQDITGGPYRYKLSHLDDNPDIPYNKIKVGQKVKAGEVIALIGNTGLSGGPHLDWSIWEPDNPQKLRGNWSTIDNYESKFIEKNVIYKDYLSKPDK
ncbi:M23 family metallopeptidase [Candidatus Pacearchaeota archaeon]|nr:M23 family metallopeptidase [Candidatus Pacearchaeota archaeon]